MSQQVTFKARPSIVSFGSGSGVTELYPAAVINPFAESHGEPEIDGAYKSENGDVIFNIDRFAWYILPKDGKEAYKIIQTGYGGSSTEFKATLVTDLDEKQKYTLDVDEKAGKASFGDKKLTILSDEEKSRLLASSRNGEIAFVGLPDVRRVEKALQFPDGDHLIVSSSATINDYRTTSRLFRGKSLNDLREIKVAQVNRYSDGGTTYYKTEEGTLFSPAPVRGGATTWTPKDSDKPVTLHKLDPEEISQRIGQSDTRISGIETWDNHQAQTQRADGKSWTDATSDRSGWKRSL